MIECICSQNLPTRAEDLSSHGVQTAGQRRIPVFGAPLCGTLLHFGQHWIAVTAGTQQLPQTGRKIGRGGPGQTVNDVADVVEDRQRRDGHRAA